MTTIPSINMLSSLIPWFGKLPIQHQETIWAGLHNRHFSASQHFKHETSNQSVHLILQGRIKVYRWNPETNRSVIFFILGQGQLFPLFDLLSTHSLPLVNHDHIEAIEPLRTISAPLTHWRQWLMEMPELRQVIYDMTTTRIAILGEKYEESVLYPVSERLIRLVKRETDKHYKYGFSMLEGLNQQEIAEQIGTSRVHLCRALKQLEKENRIARDGKNIIVKNLMDNCQKNL